MESILSTSITMEVNSRHAILILDEKMKTLKYEEYIRFLFNKKYPDKMTIAINEGNT